MKDARANIKKKKNPNAKQTDIVKILGQEYKKLNKLQLEEYHKKADKLKKEYSVTLAAYQKTKQYHNYQHQLSEWKHEQKSHWAFKKQHYYYTRDHHYLRE